MKTEYKLTKAADNCLRLEITGNEFSEYEDYVAALDEARDILAQYEDTELQTFVNVKHESELEFFISQGFYIANTMLMMEKELEEEETPLTDGKIKIIDVDRDGLSKYMEANELGFDGIRDPEEQIKYQLGLPNGRIYVLEVDEEIASSVTVWDIDETISATENIFTVPEYRGKHYAYTLLTNVLNELFSAGKKKVRLSVYGDDTPAHQMYLKMGYHITDVNYELRY